MPERKLFRKNSMATAIVLFVTWLAIMFVATPVVHYAGA